MLREKEGGIVGEGRERERDCIYFAVFHFGLFMSTRFFLELSSRKCFFNIYRIVGIKELLS